MDNFSYKVGDEVYVKPRTVTCTTRWPRGRVTSITDRGAIEVDGVHRHVADLRPVIALVSPDVGSDEDGVDVSDASEGDGDGRVGDEASGGGSIQTERRSERVTAQPWRFESTDYDR